MPLVFVHGVANREDSAWTAAKARRDAMFTDILLADASGQPYNQAPISPYWGRYGVEFAWGLASLPSGRFIALGLGDDLAELIPLADDGPRNTLLARLAKRSFADAIDLLFILAYDHLARSEQGLPAGFAGLAGRAAAYAASYPTPSWVSAADTNDEFVAKLIKALEQWRPAGGPPRSAVPLGAGDFFNALAGGINDLVSAGRNWISRSALAAVRTTLSAKVALFLGDIFVYLDKRGDPANPGPIVQEVIAALRTAQAATSGRDKLIVVGHSLGGVILYDILSGFRDALLPDLSVDVFITVGSQVALFEEMKEYKTSSDTYSARLGNKVPRPASVGRWINVYDDVDVLSFAAAPIFDGVVDFMYSSGTGLLSAHGAYFERPTFYERLRARILDGALA